MNDRLSPSVKSLLLRKNNEELNSVITFFKLKKDIDFSSL